MHNTHDPIGVLYCGALQCDGVSSVLQPIQPPSPLSLVASISL
jgi:hypothetical protein